MHILLTGATGFIGSHVLEMLLREDYKVSCLVRKKSNLRWIENKKDKITLKEGDFLYPETLEKVMYDIDVVIHIAGLPHSVDWHKYYLVNFIGTKNILQASLKSGKVKKFIYFSGQSACGPVSKGEIRDENMQCKPVSHSGKSKLLSEEEILKFKDKMDILILRPTIVYGPRDFYLLPIFKLAKNGVFITLGNPNRVINLCYIDDIVEMLSLLLKRGFKSGDIFFLGGENYPIYEVRDLFSKVFGKKLKNISIPDKFLPILGFFSEIFGRVFKKDYMLNLDLAKEMIQDNWAVSIEKISQFLNYTPYTSLKIGLHKTYEWYKKNGYL
ncbi:MAG: NAD(P)-dependent oxidoreductase [Proteobacteria bacterium]|nr:NAD(P)-dependent oxidoreductase [Pseudomonadota bacterium]